MDEEIRFFPFDESLHSPDSDEPIDVVGREDEIEYLKKVLAPALENLRPHHRRAVEMRYFEGKRLREIGEELEVSLQAAYSYLTMGLERLRVQRQSYPLAAFWHWVKSPIIAFFAWISLPTRARAMTTALLATGATVGVGIFLSHQPATTVVAAEGPAPTPRAGVGNLSPSDNSSIPANREIKTLDPATGVERVEVWRDGRIFSIYHHKPEMMPPNGRAAHFHGDVVLFDRAGKIKELKEYADGKLDGVLARWNSTGDLVSANFYDGDRRIRPATVGEVDARRMRYDHPTR